MPTYVSEPTVVTVFDPNQAIKTSGAPITRFASSVVLHGLQINSGPRGNHRLPRLSSLHFGLCPKSIQTGSTAVRLAPHFNIEVAVKNAPKDLHDAVSRTKAYLENDKLERLVVGRGSSDSSAIACAIQLHSLVVSLTPNSGDVRSISDEAKNDLESRDEAYTLSVPDDGSAATLKANSTLGLFRGLTTFGQLWYEYDGTTYTLEAPIQIQDAPAYVCFGPHFICVYIDGLP